MNTCSGAPGLPSFDADTPAPAAVSGGAIATPAIGRALGGNATSLGWITNAFMLGFGSCLMAAGALFFALNVAPTEEMILIAYKATPAHILALIAVSILLLHLIVFKAGFAGQEEADHPMKAFLHFTLPGYAIALAVSLFTLFLFGRTDGHAVAGVVQTMVVLGFPAAIGAAAARLLV